MNAEECLRCAQKVQVEKTSEVTIKLNELHKDVISQEKCVLKIKLKLNKQEYELLFEKDQAPNQEINKKREKIKGLKEELQRKECEIQSAQKEFQTRQEALSQARKELKKQHEEVIQLQREKEELACSYDIIGEQLSKLVQLLAYDKEEMQVRHAISYTMCDCITKKSNFDYICLLRL